MWIFGVSALFAATSLAIYGLSGGKRRTVMRPPWDISQVSQRYIYIVGTLSGFTVASATFLAGFFERSGSPALVNVIGMLLVAFLIFVGTAMVFATVPMIKEGADPRAVRWQYTIYPLGDCSYYIGIGVAWFSLRPFLQAVRLDFLADLFGWLLLFVTIAGAVRLGQRMYVLTAHTALTCFGMTVVGLSAAVFYRFALVPLFPVLWPGANAPLVLAVVSFAIMALGFTIETLLLTLGPNHRLVVRLCAPRSLFLPLYMQAIITAAVLMWCAVMAPG